MIDEKKFDLRSFDFRRRPLLDVFLLVQDVENRGNRRERSTPQGRSNQSTDKRNEETTTIGPRTA